MNVLLTRVPMPVPAYEGAEAKTLARHAEDQIATCQLKSRRAKMLAIGDKLQVARKGTV
jgi:hypothetical protein